MTGSAARPVRAERHQPVQPEDGDPHLQLAQQGRRAGAEPTRRSTCRDVDLAQGYDYNALILASPSGANAFDPRYGKADLWQAGTQGQFSIRYLF